MALEHKINDYQQALAEQDAADDKAGLSSLLEVPQLVDKLKRLQAKQARTQALQQQFKASDQKQLSTVDPDARLMTKHGHTVAGYNAQIGVDSLHKFVVSQDVTKDGNDTQQLAPMLAKAQDILQSDNLNGIGDAGYYDGNQLKTCEREVAIFAKDLWVSYPKISKNYATAARARHSSLCCHTRQIQSHRRTRTLHP